MVRVRLYERERYGCASWDRHLSDPNYEHPLRLIAVMVGRVRNLDPANFALIEPKIGEAYTQWPAVRILQAERHRCLRDRQAKAYARKPWSAPIPWRARARQGAP